MKKIIITLLTLITFLSLTACNNGGKNEETVEKEHIGITQGKRLVSEYERSMKEVDLNAHSELMLSDSQLSEEEKEINRQVNLIANTYTQKMKPLFNKIEMKFVEAKVINDKEVILTYDAVVPKIEQDEVFSAIFGDKITEEEIADIPLENRSIKFVVVEYKDKWYIDNDKSSELFDKIPVPESEVD